MNVPELEEECKRLHIKGYTTMRKPEMKMRLLAARKGLQTLGRFLTPVRKSQTHEARDADAVRDATHGRHVVVGLVGLVVRPVVHPGLHQGVLVWRCRSKELRSLPLLHLPLHGHAP